MLKKLRVKFILMMMSFTILLLGSIFGLIYHFTAADLAQSSFEMMQAVALRPSRPERPGSAPDSVRLPFFTVEVSKTGAITAAGSGLYDLSDEDFLRELVLAAQADGKNDGLLSSYHLRFSGPSRRTEKNTSLPTQAPSRRRSKASSARASSLALEALRYSSR